MNVVNVVNGNINGASINGNGVVINSSNNVITSNKQHKSNKMKNSIRVNETKIEKADIINKISITSFTDITISTSNSSNIEINLSGEYVSKEEIIFTTKQNENELVIIINKGNDLCSENLELDIKVPDKFFRNISINNEYGDITIIDTISVDNININAINGDIDLDVLTSNVDIYSVNGNVDLCLSANNNMNVNVSSVSGDINLELYNISKITKKLNTTNGSIDNYFDGEGEYSANLKISTINGDITIS